VARIVIALSGRLHSPILTPETRYDFSFAAVARPMLAALGVRPATAWVAVTHDLLDVRFGPWRVRTPLVNVFSAEPTGPLNAVTVLGPRLSLADLGLTFGSDTRGGVCIRFRRPVRGFEPFGLLHHPGLTVTVTTPGLLVTRLNRPDDPSATTRSTSTTEPSR